MGSLKLLQVTYSGSAYKFESPRFDKKLVIIEGPNGSGKTTFFNLIYFGLGGKVEEFERGSKNAHAEITGDQNNHVILRVSISEVEYSLLRKIGENLITVQREGGSKSSEPDIGVNTYPIFRREGVTTFSDWILERLEIPVVEIYQGGRNFKLGFNDLVRLIYHNQAPDPDVVFKPADNSNFISDSLEIRRAIFQILVGKTLLSLYEAIGKFKREERELDAARNVLKEYEQIVREVLREQGAGKVQNTQFLQERIQTVGAQVGRLELARAERLENGAAYSELMQAFDADKRRVGELSASLRQTEDRLITVARDRARVADVLKSIAEDVERVAKVIFTHEQLSLFASDTCPYCLNAIKREKGSCVCGSPVDENEYQRFFYSSNEYIDIHRAKKKSLETVTLAARSLEREFAELMVVKEKLTEQIEQLLVKIDSAYSADGVQLSDAQIEQIDEKIFELRGQRNDLLQALKMEQKLEGLQQRLDRQKNTYDAARSLVERLDLASKDELRTRLLDFNEIYNSFMRAILSDCRVACIDDETYMPVINNGIYREASAGVPKRFLYYLTLLKMSLDLDIPYPRFLLVDTPETAGIDKENLVPMLRHISTLNESNRDYQVILSTGKAKYPPEFDEYVVVRLDDSAKLLRSVTSTSSTAV